MTHTTRPTTPSEPDAAPRPMTEPGPPASTHLARCGECGHWLHVDEDELIESLDEAPLCFTCGVSRPGDAPAPA